MSSSKVNLGSLAIVDVLGFLFHLATVKKPRIGCLTSSVPAENSPHNERLDIMLSLKPFI